MSGNPNDDQAAASVSIQPGIRVNKRHQEEMELLNSLRGNSASNNAQQQQSRALRPEERAKEELERYLQQLVTGLPSLLSYPLAESLKWWADKGQEDRFPLIATAARSLLAIVPSAGHLEQDFSLAGFMVSPKRSSTEPAYVDMTLTLNSLRPEEVPRMEHVKPLGDRQAAIPQRYKDRTTIEIMSQLDQPFDDDLNGRSLAADRDLVLEHFMAKAFDPINFDDALDELDQEIGIPDPGTAGAGGGQEQDGEKEGEEEEDLTDEEKKEVYVEEEEEEMEWEVEAQPKRGQEDQPKSGKQQQQQVEEAVVEVEEMD